MQISLHQKWTAKIELNGKTWSWDPEQVVVDNKSFFKIEKWDRPFVKACYMGAKSLKFCRGSTVDCNVKFMDVLAAARQEACNRALADAMATPDAPQQDSKRRKGSAPKVTKALKRHVHFLPTMVDVALDGFVDESGAQPPIEMTLLTDAFWSKDVWVELNTDNVNFIIKAIRNDLRLGRRGRTRKSRGAESEEESNDEDAKGDAEVDDQGGHGGGEASNGDEDL